MKYVLRDNMQVDCFSDGEMVVYDQIGETTHVLNATAAMILKLIIDSEDNPLDLFVERIRNDCTNVSITTLEEDFKKIMGDFLKSKIITTR